MKTKLATRVRNYLGERNLFPETRFRIPALCCLLGWGWSVIYVASNPGSVTTLFASARELQVYLGIAFCLLVLFYLEHYLVRRFTTCKLEDRLGAWHSISSSGLILVGALMILASGRIPGSPDLALIAAAVVGEFLFAWNVIRTLTRDEVVGVFPSAVSRAHKTRGADNFGWPQSPVMPFIIAAGVFAAGGFISLVVNVPSIQIPVPVSGNIHLVGFGWIALASAVPFAFYAKLYKGLSDRYRIQFDDSLSRWHFAVTIVGVILVILQWEQSVLYRADALTGGRPLGAIAGLSAMVFGINVYRSFRRKR